VLRKYLKVLKRELDFGVVFHEELLTAGKQIKDVWMWCDSSTDSSEVKKKRRNM